MQVSNSVVPCASQVGCDPIVPCPVQGRLVVHAQDNTAAQLLGAADADAARAVTGHRRSAQHSTAHLHHASAASTATEASRAPMSCSSSVCRSPVVRKDMLTWLVAAQRTIGTSVDDSCAGGRPDVT